MSDVLMLFGFKSQHEPILQNSPKQPEPDVEREQQPPDLHQGLAVPLQQERPQQPDSSKQATLSRLSFSQLVLTCALLRSDVRGASEH